MKKFVLPLTVMLFSLNTFANCQRYFITYVENETNFSAAERKVALGLQREDYKAIFANATRPVPSACQFYIDGQDLLKKNKKSRLTEIYQKIANDGTEAPIDFISLTHGSGEGRVEVAGGHEMRAKSVFFDDMPANVKSRLAVFADFACWGIGTGSDALDAGFTSAIGINEEALGPLLARDFFKIYLEGKSLRATADELSYNCLNDNIWGIASKAVSDHREEYCKKASLLILGAVDVTIDSSKVEHLLIKNAHKGSRNSPNYRGESQSDAPLIKDLKVTVQNGDSAVKQIDLITNNDFVTRLSITSSGQIGYEVGLLNQPNGKVLSFERDPKNNLLIGFTAFSLDKNLFVAGTQYQNGVYWKYTFSIESKLGYEKIKDAAGNTRSFNDSGFKANSRVSLGYKALSVQSNSGYDLMVFNPSTGPFYSNSTIMLKKGDSSIGTYVQYNSLMGKSAGVKASISIGDISKLKEKKRH